MCLHPSINCILTDIDIIIVVYALSLCFPIVLLFLFNTSILWAVSRQSKLSERIRKGKISFKKANNPPKAFKDCQKNKEIEDFDQGTNTLSSIAIHVMTAGETGRNELHDKLEGENDLTQDQDQTHTHQPSLEEREQTQHHSVIETSTCITNHPVTPAWKQNTEKTVMVISLCTLIAYPIGIGINAVVLNSTSLPIYNYAILQLEVLNSSINVLIYWFFASRFRELAAMLRARLSVRLPCWSQP